MARPDNEQFRDTERQATSFQPLLKEAGSLGPETLLAVVESSLHDTAFFRWLGKYGKSFLTSEEMYELTPSDMEALSEAATASRLFHYIINAAYFKSLELDDQGNSGPLAYIHQLIDQTLPQSIIQIMRANPYAEPLFARDDLLLNLEGRDPRFMIAESEGAKLTGFGAAVALEAIRDKVRGYPDMLPGIAQVASAQLKEVNQRLGNPDATILAILGERDTYHTAEYATFVMGLIHHGLNARLVRERDLTPEMITDKGITLPQMDMPTRLILNFPEAESIAGGNRLALTPVREALLAAYASGVIQIAIPPKPHLGLKISRAIIQSSKPEIKAFLADIAGGKENLNFVRQFIPRTTILTGDEKLNDLDEKFIKSTGRSGEGGVAGPSPEHRQRRAMFLREAARSPYGTFVAEDAVETERVTMVRGGKPFISPIDGAKQTECYLRINVYRANLDDDIVPASVLVTGRHVPHVHTTEDALVVAGSAGKRGPENSLEVPQLPETDGEVEALFLNLKTSDTSQEEHVWSHAVLPSTEISQKGKTAEIILGMVSPEFKDGIERSQLRKKFEFGGQNNGLMTVIKEIQRAFRNVTRAGLIKDKPSKENRGVITLADNEIKPVRRVVKWWLEAQQYNTSRNRVGGSSGANIRLLERIMVNELRTRPTKVVTIVCPGYASVPGGSALSRRISQEESQPLKHILAGLTYGDGYPSLDLTVAFGHSFEMFPEFRQGMDDDNLHRALAIEFKEVENFFGDIGDVVLLKELIDMGLYSSVRDRLYQEKLPKLRTYQKRLNYVERQVVTGPLYRNLARGGRGIADLEHYIRYRDSCYAAAAVALGYCGFDAIFNTEGAIWRWSYGAVDDLMNPDLMGQDKLDPSTLPAGPVSEIWAAGDNEVVWDRTDIIRGDV